MNGRDATLLVLGVGAAALLLPGLAAAAIGGSGVNVPNAVLRWSDLAQKYAAINAALDPEDILAVIWNESTGNPDSTNPGDPSWGLMGVTFLIGRAYANVPVSTSLFDPETNIMAGAGFLAHLKAKYADEHPMDWPDAYNVGEPKFDAGVRSPTKPTYSQNFFMHRQALVNLGV